MVDTATLAIWLETTPREIRRMVAAKELVPRGTHSRGGPGRPGWWFDLDNLRGELTDGDHVADIGS